MNDRLTCPNCGAVTLPRCRIILNFDEEDAEQYLVNNPGVFVDLIDRHQDLILRQQVAMGNANLVQILNEMREALHNIEYAARVFETLDQINPINRNGPAPTEPVRRVRMNEMNDDGNDSDDSDVVYLGVVEISSGRPGRPPRPENA